MLDRRSFLLKLLIASILPVLSSCSAPGETLNIVVLANSIPPQLLGEFRAELPQGTKVRIDPEAQLKDLFELLERWQKEGKKSDREAGGWLSAFRWLPFVPQQPPTTSGLISLGHFWLKQAIAQKLIRPLKVESLPQWQKLPSSWQTLVRRDSRGEKAEGGEVWGAPYRWGTTLIAYNRDKFKSLGWTPTDWEDLWKPELRDRIAIIDQPREVIGLTLKTLGYSYNELDLEAISDLREKLAALNQQIKFYSTSAYLQPLILKDVWVAVGWSNDIFPVQKRYPEIEAIVPRSGTALWADLWVKPTGGSDRELENQWIDFCWRDKAAQQIVRFTAGSSPAILNANRGELPESLQEDAFKLPDPATIDKSEFIEPLSAAREEQYKTLWQEIRSRS